MIVIVVVGIAVALVAAVAVVLVVLFVVRRSPDGGVGVPSLPSRPRTVAPGPAETGNPATTAPPRDEVRGGPMGGPKARVTGLVSRSLDPQKVRNAVAAAGARTDACFAATELEPPNHEIAGYDLDVAASGEVTRAEPATQTGRCAELDACMVQNLRGLRMPRSPAGSTVKLTFAAKIP